MKTATLLLSIGVIFLITGCKKPTASEQASEVIPVPAETEPKPTAAEIASDTTLLESTEAAEQLSPVAENIPPVAEETQEPLPTASPEVTATESAAELQANALSSDDAYEEWFKRHALDLNAPGMLEQDPDGDGFSNRDEFLADTNPKDQNSWPGLHKELRMKDYREEKISLELESISDGVARIKRSDTGDVLELKKGDAIPGMPLVVTRIGRRVTTDKWAKKLDISEIMVRNTDTGAESTIVKDMPAGSADVSATLVSVSGDHSLKVQRNDTFAWPTEPARMYRVIEIWPSKVMVEEIETRKTWTLPVAK